jgi:hypothetical protein
MTGTCGETARYGPAGRRGMAGETAWMLRRWLLRRKSRTAAPRGRKVHIWGPLRRRPRWPNFLAARTSTTPARKIQRWMARARRRERTGDQRVLDRPRYVDRRDVRRAGNGRVPERRVVEASLRGWLNSPTMGHFSTCLIQRLSEGRPPRDVRDPGTRVLGGRHCPVSGSACSAF